MMVEGSLICSLVNRDATALSTVNNIGALNGSSKCRILKLSWYTCVVIVVIVMVSNCQIHSRKVKISGWKK